MQIQQETLKVKENLRQYFVLCILCCQFLWIVHLWLHLRYSLTFISQKRVNMCSEATFSVDYAPFILYKYIVYKWKMKWQYSKTKIAFLKVLYCKWIQWRNKSINGILPVLCVTQSIGVRFIYNWIHIKLKIVMFNGRER